MLCNQKLPKFSSLSKVMYLFSPNIFIWTFTLCKVLSVTSFYENDKLITTGLAKSIQVIDQGTRIGIDACTSPNEMIILLAPLGMSIIVKTTFLYPTNGNKSNS
jgi:hypothetical protein